MVDVLGQAIDGGGFVCGEDAGAPAFVGSACEAAIVGNALWRSVCLPRASRVRVVAPMHLRRLSAMRGFHVGDNVIAIAIAIGLADLEYRRRRQIPYLYRVLI